MNKWRVYSLLIPIIFASVGSAIFSVFTFAFDSVEVLGPALQDWIILIAGVCMAIGAELGTPGTIIEVYRKERLGKTTPWDWVALSMSLFATLIAVAIAFSRRMDLANAWSVFVASWGPIVVVGFVALDTYGAYIELGALYAESDKVETENDPPPSPMRWTEFESEVLPRLNGERKRLTVDKVKTLVSADGRPAPHDKTLERWLSKLDVS